MDYVFALKDNGPRQGFVYSIKNNSAGCGPFAHNIFGEAIFAFASQEIALSYAARLTCASTFKVVKIPATIKTSRVRTFGRAPQIIKK